MELLGIHSSFIEKGEGVLTAALLNLSAFPVELLRQVFVNIGLTWKIENSCLFSGTLNMGIVFHVRPMLRIKSKLLITAPRGNYFPY